MDQKWTREKKMNLNNLNWNIVSFKSIVENIEAIGMRKRNEIKKKELFGTRKKIFFVKNSIIFQWDSLFEKISKIDSYLIAIKISSYSILE